MLKQYMTPVAAVVAHELNMFAYLECVMKEWDSTRNVDENLVKDIRERSDGAAKIVSDLNLNMTGEKTRMLAHCLDHDVTDVETLRNRIREVRETMIQELSQVNFLRVTVDMDVYLDKQQPFGAFPPSCPMALWGLIAIMVYGSKCACD